MHSQIQVDFCIEKKKFFFSIPLLIAPSRSVQRYVEKRMTYTFQPHKTSFHLGQDAVVHLIQEISFFWGHQPKMKGQLLEFTRLAKRCRRILKEIDLEAQRDAATFS